MPDVDLRDPRDNVWDYVWCAIATAGGCDAIGGAEYKRLYQLWKDAGRPAGIAEIILANANAEPTAAPIT